MSQAGPVFAVDAAVFERFPDYIVGCVVARGIDNAAANPAIDQLLADAEHRAATVFAEVDLKEELPFRAWRSAFSTAGWSASKYPASVEALVKRVARGQPAPRISPIVDLSNATALLYAVPVGAHDLSTIEPETLTVRVAARSDRYVPLDDGQPETPEAGEIIYASGTDVRTRRWVWRQSRTALIQPTSRDVVFPIDGFTTSTASNVEAALDFLTRICRDVLDADVDTRLFDIDNPGFYG